jgi:hypothetical protein
MGISRKHRHCLVFNGSEFVWWVLSNPDGVGNVLTVASPDQRFLVRYEFFGGHTSGDECLIVEGTEFPQMVRDSPGYVRLICPRWQDDKGAITPGAVRALLTWCFASDRETRRVDWRGLPL